MIVIPAVDLRDGACVQLVGGSYAHERVRRDQPLAVAREWCELGFSRLHIVDLDAATGRGNNDAVLRDIISDVPAVTQAGGGVRTDEAVDRLLDTGASFVVLGTRAVEDEDWLGEMAATHPARIIVAADVRDRHVVTHGWRRTAGTLILDLVEELNALPLAGVLVTAVHREGQLTGADLSLTEDVAEVSAHPLLAAGGIRDVQDLRALADRGVSAAVVGMALYTGALDPRAVAEEFAA
ncbi:MAG TPA: 1-(5-phosphoribosyl)-5-[(5-phosphoribosylamino)methylideneamino] imidazole-4-carboxamide isomerase [Gemmatimonadaceae bacterium]|nr:1-(5-phosphoribosyl)-5-[(5-phosphoribosylamino)methylideneamino] imidazole-4-carboxamide isomerase [Gemmatimonadaceae bacterium]